MKRKKKRGYERGKRGRKKAREKLNNKQVNGKISMSTPEILSPLTETKRHHNESGWISRQKKWNI